ncbi:MAG TPA: hypothetical protein VFA32_18740 [Dehalococcoidia bacterium]|nr:hypothetical protein [Dehalococcoidia bacterium]
MRTLTLLFSDEVDVEDRLGIPMPAGISDEMAKALQIQTILVSDALAEIILSALRGALHIPENCPVFLDIPGHPELAAIPIGNE